jgi:hypothetical protein
MPIPAAEAIALDLKAQFIARNPSIAALGGGLDWLIGSVAACEESIALAAVEEAVATAPVQSVFGRMGAVLAQAGDYTAGDVGADPTGTAIAVVVAHESVFDHADLPSADEKDALAGTNGVPSGGNRYVTNSDPRLAAGGDVAGPASATDNAIARFDGVTGKLIQNSGIQVTDAGALKLPTAEPAASGELGMDAAGNPRVKVDGAITSVMILGRNRGILIWDDFENNNTSAGQIGECGWGIGDIGTGVNLTISKVAITPADDFRTFGQIRMTTVATNGEGGTIRLGSGTADLCKGVPPVGVVNQTKIRNSGVLTNNTAWSGLASLTQLVPTTAAAMAFIGVRAISVGGAANWFGVCKSGANQETTRDLGVPFDSAYRIPGWRRTATGIQFMVNDADVGAEITTNLPLAATEHNAVIGLVTTATGAKDADVDFYILAGAFARI